MVLRTLFVTLILVAPALAEDPFAPIDDAVSQSIAAKEMRGCVVLVLHNGEIKYHKAFGRGQMDPDVALEKHTIFDLASLTKPIATATSIWKLIEDGKLKLDDPIARHWPEFGANGKDQITIEHCLLHTSGLIADNPLADYADGKKKALERIAALKLLDPPGTKFRYSDVGFIVLGHLIERLSGDDLDAFVGSNVLTPLQMRHSRLGSIEGDPSLGRVAAPTEKDGGQWLRGVVHDPRARKMGGVAGHAGLFAPADDLANYCRMILNGGEFGGKRILKPETVQRMTETVAVPGGRRTRGFDCDTGYSRNRGELFPAGRSFGHTGFTGTSIWIDPESQSAVIFLSSRLYPDGKGNVTRIRGAVATLAARALGLGRARSESDRNGVRNGIDVLAAEKFARLKGKRVGLVTNHTGRSLAGQTTIDLLHQAEGVKLVALFSPEHGIRGALDEKVGDGTDAKTGLPIFSLYGERRKPDAASLKGIDVLVYDIQDIGCRFYTYISTLGLVMEAAAENRTRLLVLDRPNPIGGLAVEGPVLDAGKESFVAWHRLPVRHGMTIGELATLFNTERKIGVDLEVVRMMGWRRAMLFDQTGQIWVNPSPNMRSLTAALLYPGIGLLETTNISVGRGTERPFEWIGAPWLDGRKLAVALTARTIPGMRFVPSTITPTSSVHAGKACGGVYLYVDDWSKLSSVPLGIMIAQELRRLYPNDWKIDRFDRLLGHAETFSAVRDSKPFAVIEAGWKADRDAFLAVRRKYLLYND